MMLGQKVLRANTCHQYAQTPWTRSRSIPLNPAFEWKMKQASGSCSSVNRKRLFKPEETLQESLIYSLLQNEKHRRTDASLRR